MTNTTTNTNPCGGCLPTASGRGLYVGRHIPGAHLEIRFNFGRPTFHGDRPIVTIDSDDHALRGHVFPSDGCYLAVSYVVADQPYDGPGEDVDIVARPFGFLADAIDHVARDIRPID